MQSEEDLITQDVLERGEEGLPSPQREGDDGIEVVLDELADLDSVTVIDEREPVWREVALIRRAVARSGL